MELFKTKRSARLPGHEREGRNHQHHQRDRQRGQGAITEWRMFRDLARMDRQRHEQEPGQRRGRPARDGEERLPASNQLRIVGQLGSTEAT